LERGSRGGQQPASANTRKRASVSLNKAGSLEIEDVAGLSKHCETGGRNGLFQEQARLDAGVVFVAGDGSSTSGVSGVQPTSKRRSITFEF
jgi:hypothetical protein